MHHLLHRRLRLAALFVRRHEQLDDRRLGAHDFLIRLRFAQIAGDFVHDEFDLFEQRLHVVELRLFAQEPHGIAQIALLPGEHLRVLGVLRVRVLFAFEHLGLLANVVLRLRRADHRHDQLHQVGIHLAFALALGFALALELRRPLVELRAPDLRAAHGFQPEICADETGKLIQLRHHFFVLHVFLHRLVFLVRHAFEEGRHVIDDAVHVLRCQILAAGDLREILLLALGDFLRLESDRVLRQSLETVRDFVFRRRRRAHAVVEIARVKVLVRGVHLLRRRAHGVERGLLLLLRLRELLLALRRLLRALLERLRGLLHRRIRLLLQPVFELLPVG